MRAEQEDLYNRYTNRIQVVRAWFENRVKFGNRANWDWQKEKARSMNAFERKNKDVEQRDAPAAGNTAINGAVELKDGEMQLDPSLFDGINEDYLWLDLVGESGDGLRLYNNNFVAS